MKTVGIIGGSGLEDLSSLIKNIDENIVLNYAPRLTNYGETSPVAEFKTKNYHVFLISRHGLNHEISPSNVNYIANIEFLSFVGCTEIISITTCGSLREEIKIGEIVFPDQFIDFTNKRINFPSLKNKINHTSMGSPIDKGLKYKLHHEARHIALCHSRKTVVTIEGPRFSTAAESKMFQIWGADIINMTSATEIILANEFKVPIAVIAMVTDYDAWKNISVHELSVYANWETIQEVMKKNTDKILQILKRFLQNESTN